MERTTKGFLPRVCAALAMLSLLSGCVAALAVPLMTVVGAISERKRTRAQIVAALPAANAEALAALPEPLIAPAGSSAQLTGLSALPPPSGAQLSGGPWLDFASYTLGRVTKLAQGGEAVSALLTAESALTFQSQVRPCIAREPAVVIDIDTGDAPFAPAAAGLATPGVAAAVAELRRAGVIVLWVSQASANEVAGVAEALKTSGLDPTGADPILLVRNPDERKQVLREEANEAVCVVAIAGDRRSDFDELFDYLRDPRLATAYDAQLGAGWFIVPPPFETAPPAAAVTPAIEAGSQ